MRALGRSLREAEVMGRRKESSAEATVSVGAFLVGMLRP